MPRYSICSLRFSPPELLTACREHGVIGTRVYVQDGLGVSTFENLAVTRRSSKQQSTGKRNFTGRAMDRHFHSQ